VRAFERGEQTFQTGNDGARLIDQAGLPWRMTEQALVASDGRTLPRVGGHLVYWFGWHAFYPEGEVFHDKHPVR
jgi:hypothetical protein